MNCEGNIWEDILKETRLLNHLKPCKPKHVIVLGDEASGKSTLVRNVFPVKSWCVGSPLMYGYVATRDLHGIKGQTRLSVWVLNGSRDFQEKTRVLKFALTKDRMEDTMVILVTPADKPQSLALCLEYYANQLLEHIRSFGLSKEAFKKPQATSHFFQRGGISSSTGLDAVKVNLGLPVIVVVTKMDAMSSLVGEYGFQDEHFDFMQKQLQDFCINHGAALVHTSAVNDINCRLLYQYTDEWVTNQRFSKVEDEMDIVDSIFSPNNWDRGVKSRQVLFGSGAIKINKDRYKVFLDKVQSLPRTPQKRPMPELVEAEDEQIFLARLQSLLMDRDTKKKETFGSNSPLVKAEGNLTPPKPEPATTPDSKPVQTELANFFGSLLGKSTKSQSGASTPSRRYSLARDQSHLSDSKEMND